MEKLTLFLFLLFSPYFFQNQEVTGDWHGVLNVQGIELRLVIHIQKEGEAYSATLDSPDQGATGIPASSISFENGELKFEITNLRAQYSGKLEDGKINGTFTQSGQSFPLELSRKAIGKQVLSRPQEPKAPFPYKEEEVTFHNTEFDIDLAGTLTIPEGEGNFPAVVLISGSGPQDRNEELAGHKPFWVIADFLTRNGIAVLRFDDRGVAQSEGNFSAATTADLATDSHSAVNYLMTRNDIAKDQIGLIGHSEGGIIAPIVAARSEDVSFIILLAGTGIPGGDLLLLQQALIAEANGASPMMIEQSQRINKSVFDKIASTEDEEKLRADLKAYILQEIPPAFRPAGMTEDEFVDSQLSQVLTPWMRHFIRYNPALILEEVDCPVLAVNGDKDLQVPAKVNLEAIEAALQKGGNEQVTTIEFPNLNHLFQEAETGSPNEYGTIEQTFSPDVLEALLSWIQKQQK